MQSQIEYDDLVMSLVEAALARPPAEREAYLQSSCTGQPGLYGEVRTRVEWEERMGGFLQEPIVRSGTRVFQPGELLGGRFRIVRHIGSGGMGVVCEAYDEKLNRRIAIKSAQRGLRTSLSPEARAALEVSHPNVCKLHEIHSADTPDGPVDFLTMELVEGETIASRLQRDGRLTEPEARHIALQLCAGLAQAHKQGVIHGDLKTGNVILSRTPEGLPRAVLTDFGLARLTGKGSDAAADGGTPAYMAPELSSGSPPSVATDVYAIGVLFHVLLTGDVPGNANEIRLPSPWNRIITRCLAREPGNRFGSIEDIPAVLTTRPAIARWLLACAFLVISVLGIALWVNREKPGPPVRLAILPFTVEGGGFAPAAGVGVEVANQLSGIRKNFHVISPVEAARYQVDTLQKAKSVLGATHILSTRLHLSGSHIAATARLTDAASGQALRELRGEYPATDAALLAKALTATVTRNFGLRTNATQETVSPAAYPHYAQGLALLQRDTQSAAEAIPHFRKAIELDPRSALPWARLAQAQVQLFAQMRDQQALTDAGASLATAKSINPDSVPVLLASAYHLQQYGNYEQAIAELVRATELEPANPEAWRRLAFSNARSNRHNEAVTAYRKAIEVQPENYLTYASFGTYYSDRHEYDKAEEIYRQGLRVGPGIAGAHTNLGVTLLVLGRYEEAERFLRTSLELRKTEAALLNMGTLYYEKERYSEALHWYQEALSAYPSAINYRAAGDAYRKLSRLRLAREAYKSGLAMAEADLARNPRQGYTRALLAVMSAFTGDSRRAEVEISQALALEPDDEMVITDAVIVWETLGQRSKTLETLRHASPFLLQTFRRNPDMKDLPRDPRFREMLQ